MSYYDRREDRREEELYRRINDFIYAERERQRNLIDPTRRILTKRSDTVYMDKSPNGKYGVKLGTVVFVQSIMPNSIAAQKMIKDNDVVTEINERSTVNMTVQYVNKLISTTKIVSLTIDRQNSLGSWKVNLHRYNVTDRFGLSFGTRAFVDDIQDNSIASKCLCENDLLIQVDEFKCDNTAIRQIYQRISADSDNHLTIIVEKGFQGPTKERSGTQSPNNYIARTPSPNPSRNS